MLEHQKVVLLRQHMLVQHGTALPLPAPVQHKTDSALRCGHADCRGSEMDACGEENKKKGSGRKKMLYTGTCGCSTVGGRGAGRTVRVRGSGSAPGKQPPLSRGHSAVPCCFGSPRPHVPHTESHASFHIADVHNCPWWVPFAQQLCTPVHRPHTCLIPWSRTFHNLTTERNCFVP